MCVRDRSAAEGVPKGWSGSASTDSPTPPAGERPNLLALWEKKMRKVVVTGLGCVSPVGNSADETWEALKAGKSGIATIAGYDAGHLKVK